MELYVAADDGQVILKEGRWCVQTPEGAVSTLEENTIHTGYTVIQADQVVAFTFRVSAVSEQRHVLHRHKQLIMGNGAQRITRDIFESAWVEADGKTLHWRPVNQGSVPEAQQWLEQIDGRVLDPLSAARNDALIAAYREKHLADLSAEQSWEKFTQVLGEKVSGPYLHILQVLLMPLFKALHDACHVAKIDIGLAIKALVFSSESEIPGNASEVLNQVRVMRASFARTKLIRTLENKPAKPKDDSFETAYQKLMTALISALVSYADLDVVDLPGRIKRCMNAEDTSAADQEVSSFVPEPFLDETGENKATTLVGVLSRSRSPFSESDLKQILRFAFDMADGREASVYQHVAAVLYAQSGVSGPLFGTCLSAIGGHLEAHDVTSDMFRRAYACFSALLQLRILPRDTALSSHESFKKLCSLIQEITLHRYPHQQRQICRLASAMLYAELTLSRLTEERVNLYPENVFSDFLAFGRLLFAIKERDPQESLGRMVMRAYVYIRDQYDIYFRPPTFAEKHALHCFARHSLEKVRDEGCRKILQAVLDRYDAICKQPESAISTIADWVYRVNVAREVDDAKIVQMTSKLLALPSRWCYLIGLHRDLSGKLLSTLYQRNDFKTYIRRAILDSFQRFEDIMSLFSHLSVQQTQALLDTNVSDFIKRVLMDRDDNIGKRYAEVVSKFREAEQKKFWSRKAYQTFLSACGLDGFIYYGRECNLTACSFPLELPEDRHPKRIVQYLRVVTCLSQTERLALIRDIAADQDGETMRGVMKYLAEDLSVAISVTHVWKALPIFPLTQLLKELPVSVPECDVFKEQALKDWIMQFVCGPEREEEQVLKAALYSLRQVICGEQRDRILDSVLKQVLSCQEEAAPQRRYNVQNALCRVERLRLDADNYLSQVVDMPQSGKWTICYTANDRELKPLFAIGSAGYTILRRGDRQLESMLLRTLKLTFRSTSGFSPFLRGQIFGWFTSHDAQTVWERLQHMGDSTSQNASFRTILAFTTLKEQRSRENAAPPTDSLDSAPFFELC